MVHPFENLGELGASPPAGYLETVDSVLDQLAGLLPGTLIYTTQFDQLDNKYRVIATRGDESFGLEAGFEMPLHQAFCFLMATDQAPRHAPKVSEVPAYRALDPDGGIGTYAGAPISAADGTPVGSLCVIAVEEDAVDQAAVKLLPVLAATLGASLEREQELVRLQAANEALRFQASTDPLTGVANRRNFDQALNSAWKLAERGSMSSYVVVSDLDRFKELNDEFGHMIGDLALIALADSLEHSARESDLVGRLGGDEFAVILRGCSSDSAAEAFISRAETDFRRRWEGEPVSFSSGYAPIDPAGTPELAVEEADRLMYEAKASRGDS